MSGKLEKLTIKAFENDVVTVSPDLTFTALVNPESFTVNHSVRYNAIQTPGSAGTNQQYVSTAPPTLQINILFDGTGVLPLPLEGIAGALSGVPGVGAVAGAISGLLGDTPKYDIQKEIDKFKKIVYEHIGTNHAPRKVQLTWGMLLFEGVLTSLSLNFKLFSPAGIPLRAVATATFSASIEDVIRVVKQNNSSPDLTHVRVVKRGDRLPLMAYKIYGDSSYYLEVARVNNLTNFRNLNPGDKIFFPPLDKSKK
jgi:nucleoid-associated protein YgaU